MEINSKQPKLTPDDRIWRINWFSQVAYRNNANLYSQPSLRVTLSPLLCDPEDNDALLSPDCTDQDNVHEAWLPIAALPTLTIGSLWQNGNPLRPPSYQSEKLEKVTIDAKHATLVKTGLAIDGEFLLPWSRHPWHRKNTQAYCVSVALPNNRRLIVPCIEIIRWYFGSTSKMIQRLFTVPLSTNNALWARYDFDEAKKHLYVALADGISGNAASHIGRIILSPAAKRSAASIYAYCQAMAGRNEPIYPNTGFPFEGKTDLAVAGVWLPFGGRENATFLAYRIESCSHQFPFESLTYDLSNQPRFDPERLKGKGKNRGGNARGSSKKTSEITNADARKTNRRYVPPFIPNRRFPDLEGKPVWRENTNSVPPSDVYMKASDGSVKRVAFGESDYSTDVGGIDAALENNGKPKKLPRFVYKGLMAIENDETIGGKSANRTVVCPQEYKTPLFSLPLLTDEDGSIPDELYMTSANGQPRPRHACFVETESKRKGNHRRVIVEGHAWDADPLVLPIEELTPISATLAFCNRRTENA